jgi:hypothetical protein
MSIGAAQDFAGSKRPRIERVSEGFDRRAQSSQPPVERASLQSAVADASHAQTDELHTLVNTAVQVSSVAERDLDRRFSHLSHTLHARTQRGARPAMRFIYF